MVKRIILIVAIAMIAFSGVALADTANVQVTANVVGTCRVLSNGTLPFGPLDPATGGLVNNLPTATQPTFWCTNGTAYTITDDGGSRGNFTMKRSGSNDFIAYSIAYTSSGTGAGRSTTLNPNISGSVAEVAYINAPEGDYSDTVILTIAP